jgi:hypothetical protein
LQESKLVQKKAEKRELIERIRKLDSTVKVSEKNTVLELTEILEGLLEAEEDKKDEDEEEDDEENEENEENEDEKEEKEDEENEEKLFDDADLDDVYLEPDDDEGSDYE